MQAPAQAKKKIQFSLQPQLQPVVQPIQPQQGLQQQGNQEVQQQQQNVVPPNNQNAQQYQANQPPYYQQNNPPYPQRQLSPFQPTRNNQNPPSNNPIIYPQPQAQQQMPLQNNINKIQYEEPRRKEIKPEIKIEVKANTPLEDRELKFQSKNRLETSKFFKGYVESSSKNSFKQSCIIDLPQQIANTKAFFLRQQGLAIKIQDFMRNYLQYEDNQKEARFGLFIQNCFVSNQQVNLPYNLKQQLSDNNKQPREILLNLTFPPSNEDMTFLRNIQSLVSFLEQSKTIDTLAKSSSYDQLSPLSKFVYRHFVLKFPCCLEVDDSDFYLFSSCEGSPNDNVLLQLLLQTLKHEEKLVKMISQSEKTYPNDEYQFRFKDIEQFIDELQKSKTLSVKIQLLIGYPPSATPNLKDKYNELWDLYAKGCKSQVFKKIVEASWPERSFMQGFEQTFGMVVQFQLFIIWLQQMQEKIIDFQQYARACVSPGNIQDSKKEISINLRNYIESFKAELQSLLFRQIASKAYGVATALTNKDISKQTKSVFQIFFSKDEQSQLLLGNIVCQKTNSSLCFYFRDQNDNYQFKQVSVCFVQGRGSGAPQPNCDASFLVVDSKVDRQFNFYVSDYKEASKNYAQFGRFYDTVLINKLIEKTRSQRDTQINFDLSELLSLK